MMITDAMARALDSAGDGIGRVFAHYKIGAMLVAMCGRIDALEKKVKTLENKLKAAEKADKEIEK